MSFLVPNPGEEDGPNGFKMNGQLMFEDGGGDDSGPPARRGGCFRSAAMLILVPLGALAASVAPFLS